jgi:hypothetical protein
MTPAFMLWHLHSIVLEEQFLLNNLRSTTCIGPPLAGLDRHRTSYFARHVQHWYLHSTRFSSEHFRNTSCQSKGDLMMIGVSGWLSCFSLANKHLGLLERSIEIVHRS